MPTQEISRKEWKRFFEEFNSRHEGWLITVEVLSPDIGSQVQVRELPLEGIVFESTDEGDQLTVMSGNTTDARISHTINTPLRVWLKQNEQGNDEALEIESKEGAVLLRFRSTNEAEQSDRTLSDKANA